MTIESMTATRPFRELPIQAAAPVITAWMLSMFFAGYLVQIVIGKGTVGQDAHAYWMTGQAGSLYEAGPAQVDAFLYSPLFAWAIWPLTLLPFAAFYAVWAAAGAAMLVWLVKPLPIRWAVPVFLLCTPDLLIGNIYVMLAFMVALGVRYPGVWAFGILTKITPGVGLVWFLVRREWKQLAIGTGLTAGLAVAAYAVAPGSWAEWVSLLADNRDGAAGGTLVLVIRCALGFVLVVYGARTGRPWLLAVAVTLVAPVLNAFACLGVLAAIPRLLEDGREKAPRPSEEDRGGSVVRGSDVDAVMTNGALADGPRDLAGG